MKHAGFILLDAGISDYDAVYEMQRELVRKKRENPSHFDYLIFVEHPDVYTYGRKNKPNVSLDSLKVYFIERGGEMTFHNVGQLVCYPIVRLHEGERDLHLYLRNLERVLIEVLQEYSIKTERHAGATGVWLREGNKKIASIGVAVSSWVTYHGCALNVDNDLRGFATIRPCGFPSHVMTSMKEVLGEECPPITQVKGSFLRHFSSVFERRLVV